MTVLTSWCMLILLAVFVGCIVGVLNEVIPPTD